MKELVHKALLDIKGQIKGELNILTNQLNVQNSIAAITQARYIIQYIYYSNICFNSCLHCNY